MEKNLDIDKTAKKQAFTKNHNDGIVIANMNLTTASNIFAVVVNISKSIVLSFFSRFLMFFIIFFTIFCHF